MDSMMGETRFVPRTLLMTTDTVGGVWTYTIELTRALQQHHVHVALATMGDPINEQQKYEISLLDDIEVYESTYKLEWMDDPWDDVYRAGDWLLKLEETIQPDIVHLNSYSHGSLPWFSPVLMVGHSCVYSWFEAVKEQEPSEEWHTYRHEVYKGLRCADLVTAPSHFMLSALRKHYGAFTTLGPIYNSRRSSYFSPLPKEDFIITVGRIWDEAKNIQAIEKVALQIPWKIYAAGEKQHPCGGTAELNQVEWLGRLDSAELSTWLNRAAIFVLPALYEPFGLSILEAGLSGCALILGDTPSLREVWGDAAIYVSPKDHAAIEEAIHRLIQDEELRKQYAQRAYEKAQEYTPQRMSRDYMKFYQHIMRNHKYQDIRKVM